MKADGSIIIDTKIVDGGMEKGFELIKDEMASVGITAKEVGEQIKLTFSKMDVSKPIANAVSKVEQLEGKLAAATSDYMAAISDDDNVAAERAAARRIATYDRLEAAREKLAIELAHAVQKEADKEEEAVRRSIKAAEKETKAKKRELDKQYKDMMRPARRFGTRLREIVTGALFFNVLSAGLRNVTGYFGTALKANEEYSSSLARLNGSLRTAFQPIYETALPAIISFVDWLNTAVQVVGRFFSALTGKNYSQMQKNAKALNNQAGALSNVGDAAEEAQKQLAGFDEINRLEAVKNATAGGTTGAGNTPVFDTTEIPSEWETAIDSLALRIKDIFFKWDDLNAEDIAQKLITAIGTIAGGLIGFTLGGPAGALIGMTIGAGLGVVISKIIFNRDGKLSQEELLSALVTTLLGITGGVIGFMVGGPLGAAIGITIGAGLGVKLTTIMFDGDGTVSAAEMIRALVAGLSVIAGAAIGFVAGGPAGAVLGATVGLALGFTIQAIEFDRVEETVRSMLDSICDYFAKTFSDGFIHGLATMVEDGVMLLWNFFADFVGSIVRNWNNIWGGNSQYQYTGTIGPQYYAEAPAMAAYSRIPEIPALARGAVLPANKPFLAVVGDQKHGTNVEAPLETIKQALAEVMAQHGGGDINIRFVGELAQLARVLTPEITRQQNDDARAEGW